MELYNLIKNRCLNGRDSVAEYIRGFDESQVPQALTTLASCIRSALAVAPIIVTREILHKVIYNMYINADMAGDYADVPNFGVNMPIISFDFVDKDGNIVTSWDIYDRPWSYTNISDAMMSLSTRLPDTMNVPVLYTDGWQTVSFRYDGFVAINDEWPRPRQALLPAYTQVTSDKCRVYGHGWKYMYEDQESRIYMSLTIGYFGIKCGGIGAAGNGVYIVIDDNKGVIDGIEIGSRFYGKSSVGMDVTQIAKVIFIDTDSFTAVWW